MNLTGFPSISGGQVNSDSATALSSLGSINVDSRGRLYRYVLAGAQPLVVGNVVQAPAQVAVHGQLTPTVGQGVGSSPDLDATHPPRVDRCDVVDHEGHSPGGGHVAELA